MNISRLFREETLGGAVQLFEPDPSALYSMDAVAQLMHLPRRTILVYCKHGLVAPVGDPASRGYHFGAETIRTLRQIQSLRVICGDDLAGIRMILELMGEVHRLRTIIVEQQRAHAGTPEEPEAITLLAS